MDDPASLFLLFFAETASVEVPTLSSTALKLLLVVFLVLANGFFVAAEFALVAVRKSRIETLANEGSAAAETASGIIEQSQRLYLRNATRNYAGFARTRLGWRTGGCRVARSRVVENSRSYRIDISRFGGGFAFDLVCHRIFVYHVSAHRFWRTRAENRRARTLGKSFSAHRSAVADFLQDF